MFLIAVRRTSADWPQAPAHLQSARVPLSDGFESIVWYDVRRFSLDVSPSHLTLTDALISSQHVIRMRVPDGAGSVAKPLMLGLPVYYTIQSDLFLASTHVRLFQPFGVRLRENEAVLPEFFLYRYVTPPRTMFQDVGCLPIGGELDFDIGRPGRLADEPTWTDAFTRTSSLRYSLDESAELIRQELSNRIEDLRSHAGAVACLLSGGIDSSILYSLSKEPLRITESHSTGYSFEDPARNEEKIYAETAAAAFGAAHRYHVYDADEFMAGTIDAIDQSEVPVVALQSVLMHQMTRNLGEGIRLVLCGQGADALFGLSAMYHFHHYRALIHPAFAPVLGLLAAMAGRLGHHDSRMTYARLQAYAKRRWGPDFRHPRHGLWLLGEFADKAWVKMRFGIEDHDLIEGRRAAINHFQPEDDLDAFCIMDMVSDVTTIQDTWGKMGSSHGRWLHYTFNSPALIKAAYHTSWNEKLSEPKMLVRKVGQRSNVPEFILSRPKRGFGIAAVRWALPGGPLQPLISVASAVVGPDTLRRFQSGNEPTAMTLWSLINYAIWKRLLINEESAASLHGELRRALSVATQSA